MDREIRVEVPDQERRQLRASPGRSARPAAWPGPRGSHPSGRSSRRCRCCWPRCRTPRGGCPPRGTCGRASYVDGRPAAGDVDGQRAAELHLQQRVEVPLVSVADLDAASSDQDRVAHRQPLVVALAGQAEAAGAVVDRELEVELVLDAGDLVAQRLLALLLLALLVQLREQVGEEVSARGIGLRRRRAVVTAPRSLGPGPPPGALLEADDVGLHLLDLLREQRGADRRELGRVHLVVDLSAGVDRLVDGGALRAPGSGPRPDTGCGVITVSCGPSSCPWPRRRRGAASGPGRESAPGPAPARSAPACPGTMCVTQQNSFLRGSRCHASVRADPSSLLSLWY